jgi:hypothetical protein
MHSIKLLRFTRKKERRTKPVSVVLIQKKFFFYLSSWIQTLSVNMYE